MRVVLFTGKGGVGKTTVAAATAVRAARGGHRTLVMSTDPAHSLADSFEVEIGSSPVEITDRLRAVQIDAQERLDVELAKVRWQPAPALHVDDDTGQREALIRAFAPRLDARGRTCRAQLQQQPAQSPELLVLGMERAQVGVGAAAGGDARENVPRPAQGRRVIEQL